MALMKFSFPDLSAQEALHVAIFIEERNAEIYHHFAEMFASFQDSDSLEIASTLWDMATEERTHGTMLQQRYTARYGLAACALTEANVIETIELPKLTDQEIFDASTESATSQIRALNVALQAENQARDFYAELAKSATDDDLRALYVELSSFEAAHVEFLERRVASYSQRG